MSVVMEVKLSAEHGLPFHSHLKQEHSDIKNIRLYTLGHSPQIFVGMLVLNGENTTQREPRSVKNGVKVSGRLQSLKLSGISVENVSYNQLPVFFSWYTSKAKADAEVAAPILREWLQT